MNWQTYSIISPTLGLDLKSPSILLRDASSPDLLDVYFHNGEVHRYRKRILEFSQSLPHEILCMEEHRTPSEDAVYYMVLTKRDVTYWDTTAERFVFLNKVYNEGTIVNAVENTDGTFTLTFDLPSGESMLTATKAGDYIRLSNEAGPYTSDDVWYEIVDINGADEITVEGVLPSGYEVSLPSGGDTYAIRTTFTGNDKDYWHVDTHEERFVATNNGADYPIRWTGSGQVEDITDEFRCKALVSYERRLHFLYTIETGTSYPTRWRWSDLIDETIVVPQIDNDAGAAEVTEGGSGYLTKGIVFNGYLFFVKSSGFVRAIAVATDEMFNKREVSNDTGTIASLSFVKQREYIYFYCTTDLTIKRFDGMYFATVSTPIDYIVKNVTTEHEDIIQATYINEFQQILWAIPYAGETTLNKVLIWDMDNAPRPVWTVADMDVTCFGFFRLTEDYSWSNLPYDEWLDWNANAWRSREGLASFGLNVCGRADGTVCRLNASRQDLGENYDGYIVFDTDLSDKKSALPYKKRLLKMQFYVRNEAAGHLDISVKRDLETDWQDAGDVSLVGDENIIVVEHPVDFLAKTFKVKISSKYDFNLIGVVFWFIPVGER